MAVAQPPLTGARKAAIVMMALGEGRSAEVFKFLQEHEVEALAREVANAGKVPADVGESVLAEFMDMTEAADHIATGGVEQARRLLEQSVGPGNGPADHRPGAHLVQGHRRLRLAREGQPGTAVEVHPRRAPADHRRHPVALERQQRRAAHHAAARRAAGGRDRADGQHRRDPARGHRTDLERDRPASEVARRSDARTAGRRQGGGRAVQPDGPRR